MRAHRGKHLIIGKCLLRALFERYPLTMASWQYKLDMTNTCKPHREGEVSTVEAELVVNSLEP